MKYLLLALMLISSPAWGVEMLVCAKDSPFDKGCKKGDILIVRPDGHKWGNEECLPNYIQVSVPDMTFEEAKIYEDNLMTDDGVDAEGNPKQKMLRLRKYNIDPNEVETAKSSNGKLVRDKKTREKNIRVKTQ